MSTAPTTFACLTAFALAGSIAAQEVAFGADYAGENGPAEELRPVARAIEAVGRMEIRGRAAAPALVAVAQREPTLRFIALEAIWNVGGADVTDYLLTCLEDENERVRLSAAKSLACIGGHSEVLCAVLRKTLAHEVDEMTYRLFEVGRLLGPDAEPLAADLRAYGHAKHRTDVRAGIDSVLRDLHDAELPSVGVVVQQFRTGGAVDTALIERARARTESDASFTVRLAEQLQAQARHLRGPVPTALAELTAFAAAKVDHGFGMASPAYTRHPDGSMTGPTTPGAEDASAAELFAEFCKHAPPRGMWCGTGFDWGGWARVQANFRKFGAPTVPFLIEQLEAESTRWNAMQALGATGPAAAAAVPALVEQLDNMKFGRGAVEALGLIGAPAIPALVAKLEG